MKLNTKERKDYQAPAFVYEGKISTRAGSPLLAAPDDASATDLFGD